MMTNEIEVKNESEFKRACESIGYECIKTSEQVAKLQHVDFYVKRPEGLTSVYVKRNNTPKKIFVELKNVDGIEGWLYRKADYIAFDIPNANGFIVVKRTELLNYCEKVVEKVFVEKKDATRKLYTTQGCNDVLTILELTDLAKLKSFKTIKYSETAKTNTRTF
jgi:hypothetical protein